MSNTQEKINEVCEYRGLPKITKGDICEVNGRKGKIWGGNPSANFNVKFDDDGAIRNCHPEWKMKIFDASGAVIHECSD